MPTATMAPRHARPPGIGALSGSVPAISHLTASCLPRSAHLPLLPQCEVYGDCAVSLATAFSVMH